MTLAYVFWHRARDGTVVDSHESALREFHRQLAAAGVPEFQRSWTLALARVPWLGDRPGYEDWYLVDSFAALGALNTAAVGDTLRGAHDAAAVAATDGTAGVYALLRGEPRPQRHAEWMSKPDGVGYPEFLATLPAGGVLWQRQLTLGPAPEFVLTDASRSGASAGWSTRPI